MCNEPGDFILIDRIIIQGYRPEAEWTTDTTRQPTFEYTLDKKNDSSYPWSMSPRYDGWFSYHDTLADLDLDDLEEAEGIWASFYDETSPVFGHPFPFIEFTTNFQAVEDLEIRYYINGTANITLEGVDVITNTEFDNLTWKIFKTSFSSSDVSFFPKL